MITIGAGIDTRLGALEHYEEGMLHPPASLARAVPPHREAGRLLARMLRWMIRGYQRTNATDLASAIAFQALVAVVPMFLLLISIGGLFLQDDRVLQQAILTIAWILPSRRSRASGSRRYGPNGTRVRSTGSSMRFVRQRQGPTTSWSP